MTDTSESSELFALSHEIARAIAERDESKLTDILADDFVHVATNDETSTRMEKAAFLAGIVNASYEIVDIELEGLQIELDRDVAVVVGTQRARVNLEDSSTVTSIGSFTDVFRTVNGRWHLWLAHSTELSA